MTRFPRCSASTRLGLLAVLICYVASFLLPALAIPLVTDRLVGRLESEIATQLPGEVTRPSIDRGSFEGDTVIHLQGYECFWKAMLVGSDGTPLLAWLANPMIWTGILLIALGRSQHAVWVSILATALALSAAFVLPYVGRADADVVWSWHDYRAGYWVWLGSAALLVAVSASAWRSHAPQVAKTLMTPVAADQP